MDCRTPRRTTIRTPVPERGGLAAAALAPEPAEAARAEVRRAAAARVGARVQRAEAAPARPPGTPASDRMAE